jgi:hypothetical protein
MTSMQDRLLGQIRQLAEDQLGLQLTRQPDHANTGDLYVRHGPDTLLVIGYRFNPGYCGFHLHGPAVQAAPAELRARAPGLQPDPAHIRFHHVDYADDAQTRAVQDLICDLLAPYELPRNRALPPRGPRGQITAILTEHAAPGGAIPAAAIPDLTTELTTLLETTRPGPASPDQLTRRQLYLVRCLLMRATEQGSPEPGLPLDTVAAGALEYAGTVTPPVTRPELDEVLRIVFNGPVAADSGTPGNPDRDHRQPGPVPARTTAASRPPGRRQARPAHPAQPGIEAEP